MPGVDERLDLLLDDDLDATDVRQAVVADEDDPHRAAFAGSERYHPHVTTNARIT